MAWRLKRRRAGRTEQSAHRDASTAPRRPDGSKPPSGRGKKRAPAGSTKTVDSAGRGGRAKLPTKARPAEVALDSETADALTLFNAYLEADREHEKRKRELKRAETAKSRAAAAVRRLNSRKAPAAEVAAAETAYRSAVKTLNQLKKNGSSGGTGS